MALAVFCSDIHLSHRPSVARSAESDWYAAMDRTLEQVRQICRDVEAPLVIAGDIFDRWNSPPELINFAIDQFHAFSHGVYAIPGQHDLPEHSNEQRHRSAYGSLERAGAIIHLDSERPAHHPSGWGLSWIHPFGWGTEVKPCEGVQNLNVVVIHAFIWKTGTGYPGASESSNVVQWKEKLKGYDLAFFGDNHKGFCYRGWLYNCGTLMRRKLDERDYKPCVLILKDDGLSVRPHFLDISQDKWIDDGLPEDVRDIYSEYLKDLGSLGSDSLDFREVVKQRLDERNASDGVRKMVLESLEQD
jgi:DNA repair exonuclease SbcCD nuclease subunit